MFSPHANCPEKQGGIYLYSFYTPGVEALFLVGDGVGREMGGGATELKIVFLLCCIPSSINLN